MVVAAVLFAHAFTSGKLGFQIGELAHVQSVQKAADQLGAQAGVKVSVALPLQNQAVLVSGPIHNPQKTLEALAFALHASLESTSNGLRISRSVDQSKQINLEDHVEVSSYP